MSTVSPSSTSDSTGELGRRASASTQPKPARWNWLDRWSRRAVLSQLQNLQHGHLCVRESAKQLLFGNLNSADRADIEVLDPRFYREVALGSSLGAGDAFVHGYWRSNDLLAVMRLFAKNLTQRDDLQTFALPLQKLGRQLLRFSNRNTRDGSRRNIGRHYDLSNEMFALFLDPTMTYSCGVFDGEDVTLEEASLAKYKRICQKLTVDC